MISSTHYALRLGLTYPIFYWNRFNMLRSPFVTRIASWCLTMGLVALAPFAAQAAERPNIIYIMADDMGFSDIGCYGSEISTPNLDGLAEDGVRFTQFYNTARCCPTRAS